MAVQVVFGARKHRARKHSARNRREQIRLTSLFASGRLIEHSLCYVANLLSGVNHDSHIDTWVLRRCCRCSGQPSPYSHIISHFFGVMEVQFDDRTFRKSYSQLFCYHSCPKFATISFSKALIRHTIK